MNFRYLPPAQAELDEAVVHYEEQCRGLGAELLAEVRRAVDLILDHPNAWPRVSGEVRSCQTRRFPYRVLYTVGEDHVLILAVMHQHRRPGYRKDRT